MAFKVMEQQREGEEREVGQLGLKKKIIKLGLGYFKPETGDEVSGTYLSLSHCQLLSLSILYPYSVCFCLCFAL